MKIRLAILEMDENYLERIVSVFGTKFADKFEIYSFTDLKAVIEILESAKIDVMIANDIFDIDVSDIPKRCSLVYFVDTANIDMLRGQKAIFKFQKAELIYKQILNIYSEKVGNTLGMKGDNTNTSIILFDSISGGVGTSSMASACALHYAKKQKKVLYLNLEKFGGADAFFSAEGQFNLSDVIYALKSRKANILLKLESCVKQDARGVFFYAKPKVALDMLELNSDEIINMILELKKSGVYDLIIIDTDLSMNKEFLQVYRQAQSIVWVSDGSEISNEKIISAFTVLSILEKNAEDPLNDRIFLIYNKFSNKTSRTIEESWVKDIGGAPKYEYASIKQIQFQLSQLDIFDKINELGGMHCGKF